MSTEAVMGSPKRISPEPVGEDIADCPLRVNIGKDRWVNVTFQDSALSIRLWEMDSPGAWRPHPEKGVTLSLCNWCALEQRMTDIDNVLVKIDNNKRVSREMIHLMGDMYVSLDSQYRCVNIREFSPRLFDNGKGLIPTRHGIALKFSEWDQLKDFLQRIPACERSGSGEDKERPIPSGNGHQGSDKLMLHCIYHMLHKGITRMSNAACPGCDVYKQGGGGDHRSKGGCLAEWEHKVQFHYRDVKRTLCVSSLVSLYTECRRVLNMPPDIFVANTARNCLHQDDVLKDMLLNEKTEKHYADAVGRVTQRDYVVEDDVSPFKLMLHCVCHLLQDRIGRLSHDSCAGCEIDAQGQEAHMGMGSCLDEWESKVLHHLDEAKQQVTKAIILALYVECRHILDLRPLQYGQFWVHRVLENVDLLRDMLEEKTSNDKMYDNLVEKAKKNIEKMKSVEDCDC